MAGRVKWSARPSAGCACALFGFLQTWGSICGHFSRSQEARREISVPDGLEPSVFGGKPSRGVQVADGGLHVGEFVDVVDCLARLGAVPHGVYVTAQSADRRDAVERIEGVAAIGAV